MEITRTLDELRAQIGEWRRSGDTTAFVPTMGALHAGHLSLVKLAREKADRVIVSIFVNPTQFAPGEDLDAYPRTQDQDCQKLRAQGVDMVYIPSAGTIYSEDHATQISLKGVAQGLETDNRPGFFDGVALVVTKLFNRVQPDIAVFGEKDYQQLATIRRLVADLDMPIKIIGGPIARDDHGLALSSRNQYFDKAALSVARKLNVIMKECARRLSQGETVETATGQAHQDLLGAGFSQVDYVSVAHANTLQVQNSGLATEPSRLLIAAHCHGVRLIDNCAITNDTELNL